MQLSRHPFWPYILTYLSLLLFPGGRLLHGQAMDRAFYLDVLNQINAGKVAQMNSRLDSLYQQSPNLNQDAWFCFLQGHVRYRAVDFSGESWLEQGLTQAPPQDYQLLGNIQYDLAGYDFMTAQYPQSLAHLQASRNYKQEYLPRLDVEMGKCYDFLGLLQSNLEAYAEALNSFQLAASIYAQDSTPEYRRLQTDLVHKQANCYYRMGQYAQAEQLYAKALAGWQEIDGPDHKIAAAYSGLGNVHDEWQDYEQALSYHELALETCADCRRRASYLINLGVTQHHLQATEAALASLSEAMELLGASLAQANLDQLPRDARDEIATLHLNMGELLLRTSAPTEALAYFESALALRKTIYPAIHPRIAAAYMSLGDYYLQQTDHAQAKHYYRRAERSRFENATIFHPEIAANHLALAKLYQTLGQWDSAMFQTQNTLATAGNDFFKSDLRENPNAHQLHTPYQAQLLEALYIKGDLWMTKFRESKDSLSLVQAAEAYGLAIQLVDSIRQDLTTTASRRYWQTTLADLYESALESVYQQYLSSGDSLYVAQAFQWMEQAKSALLLIQLREREAREFLGVSPAWIGAEARFRNQIRILESKAFEQAKNGEPFSETDQRLLRTYHMVHDSLIQELEASQPDYHRYKYQRDTRSMASLQAGLKQTGQQLIEYLAGDSSVYVLSISSGEFSFRKIPQAHLLYEELHALQRLMVRPQWSEIEIEAYPSQSQALFRRLLGPEIERHPDLALLLVPDQDLIQFPFEALLTLDSPTEFAQWKYLIETTPIQYTHSVGVLSAAQTTLSRNRNPHFLATFAPDFPVSAPPSPSSRGGKDQNWPPLLHNVEEAILLAELYDSDSFVKEEASKVRFLSEANQYQILHLSTHAISDPENPMNSYLVMADSALSVGQILQLQLDADLVVLSACETGKGDFVEGDGVMSLAHAFAYAGCPNTVMSLWSVDDQGTAQLMETFYRQLRQGQQRDIALQKAKIAFLAQAPALHRLPFYWAGFQSWGDPTPLPSSPLWYAWVGGLLILIALATGGWLLRNRRRI